MHVQYTYNSTSQTPLLVFLLKDWLLRIFTFCKIYQRDATRERARTRPS